jgi:uncharacterized protein YdhG (YjbR/CyaY superfamily)
VKKTETGQETATTVDEYLAGVPEPDRAALEHLRTVIRAAAPGAEETIGYRMPAYKYRGPLVFFAAFPHHLSLYGVSRPLLEAFRDDLAGFEVSGTTIHFLADRPLPDELVTRLVRARMQENEARGGHAYRTASGDS